MKAQSFIIENDDDLKLAYKVAGMTLTMQNRIELTIGKPKPKQRTVTQNASLHQYAEEIATLMNEAGITQRLLVGKFKDGFELPVTKYMIKDIFREVGRAMFQKDSTTKLLTTEISEVYRVVDERFGEVHGVRAEWPNRHGV